MEILYGTTNPAKIEFMQRRVDPLGIKILSLHDVGNPQLEIDECGNDPLENARIKALAYYNALQIPVFSCDSGLYFDEVDDARQPGLYIRRVNGKVLTDDEMVEYYGGLAKEFGGKLTARYQNAICFVKDANNFYEYMDEDTASEPFWIVPVPHEHREEGFPIDRLSVDIATGKYYNDLPAKEKKYINDGFVKFFQRIKRLYATKSHSTVENDTIA